MNKFVLLFKRYFFPFTKKCFLGKLQSTFHSKVLRWFIAS